MQEKSSENIWMNRAIELAKIAEDHGEVPVGAVLVHENQIIAEGWNQPIKTCDPTAHAEIIALRQAAAKLNNYRLLNTNLYVTLEPCAMCIGAIMHARVKRLIFGAFDVRFGAVNMLENNKFNHTIECQGGIMAEECAKLLRDFFQSRRKS